MLFRAFGASVANHPDRVAVAWRGRATTFGELGTRVAWWQQEIDNRGIQAGAVFAIRGDFSPESIALLLAAIESRLIVVPIWSGASTDPGPVLTLGQVQHVVSIDPEDRATISAIGARAPHPLYDRLRNDQHPGLVLFSSGSTGAPKGVVHDLVRLLRKYETPRKSHSTLAFLLFDHIGGLDTLFYGLANGSALIVPDARTPEAVCAAIARHRAEVLPTAPSFLNLMLLGEQHRRHDLSSLRYITYGAEMMPQHTLQRLAELFPRVTLLQKYGTSEIGTMRSSSEAPDSLWVRIGGEGYRWRVVDGELQVQADSAMLGYLNAPSPFTPDGWFRTGDCVEVRGELIRFLGRSSDLINVGGQKVYPAEVEAVIAELPEVADVSVYGERNALLGNVVAARVQVTGTQSPAELRTMIRRHCTERLAPYKIPSRIELTAGSQVNERSKKLRRDTDDGRGT